MRKFPDALFCRPHEVLRVLEVSLLKLLSLPYLNGIPFEYYGTTYTSPIFDLKRVGIDIEQKIYGGTAHVLYETLQLVAQALKKELPPVQATYTEFPFNHKKS